MTTAPETPDWVRDAIFYQIFPDRFAQSTRVTKAGHLQPWGAPPTPHGYQGGDLLGVSERLDYLNDLGINAIYFTPVFQSASNHRYHTHDYEQVDPMLGGNEALRELIDKAHDRGIRIVLDGVFNHASRGFFQFNDILENGRESAYVDWFSIFDFPVNAYDEKKRPNYAAWWNLHALPKFRTETPAVREFIFRVARRWIDFGIDGWRLDVPSEIDDLDFWREFRTRVKEGNPESYIVGEIWEDGSRWLQGDMFDAVMNYIFTRSCLAFFISEKRDRTNLAPDPLRSPQRVDASQFAQNIEALQGIYHPNVTAVMLNLIGSHDMARFGTLADDDLDALKLATLFQMTYPGAPCIYYGDEIGMLGGHDPECRGAFSWDQATWNQDLLAFFRKVIHLRRDRRVFRRGRYQVIDARGDCFSFARVDDHESAVIILNVGESATTLDLEIPENVANEGTILTDYLSTESWNVAHGALRSVQMTSRTGRVLIGTKGL